MNLTPFHQRIYTLPKVINSTKESLYETACKIFSQNLISSIDNIYLVGCGDSYHACVGAVLAFHQLTGIPTQAISSLTFSRYRVKYIPKAKF